MYVLNRIYKEINSYTHGGIPAEEQGCAEDAKCCYLYTNRSMVCVLSTKIMSL